MKIEIRNTTKKGVVQITTLDERWYQDGEIFRPSASWISSYYPKGIEYYKWLAKKGWDEAEEIKNLAGERGSRVHKAIEKLNTGEELKMDAVLINSETKKEEELTPDEWSAVVAYANWFNEVKPKIIGQEFTVINEQQNYAGTVDLKCEIDGEIWIIDVKTSKYIWPSHRVQLASYKHAEGCDKIAILQVGYERNKFGYKFTEIEDQYDLFLSAYKIWENENKDVVPKQKDYPVTIKLIQK